MRGLRTAMKSGPRLPQLEKALAQKQRPNTAKNKYKNKLKKKKDVFKYLSHLSQLQALFSMEILNIRRLVFQVIRRSKQLMGNLEIKTTLFFMCDLLQ